MVARGWSPWKAWDRAQAGQRNSLTRASGRYKRAITTFLSGWYQENWKYYVGKFDYIMTMMIMIGRSDMINSVGERERNNIN